MKKYRFFSGLLAVLLLLTPLTVPALALDDPDPQCGAAILVDGDHDEVLYSKNGNEKMYPASITKIMTSLLVLEAIQRGEFTLDTPVTATASAVASIPADSSTQNIKAGEVLTVEQLLYCDLVASANEACAILAELVGGTQENFVVMMNARAAELGMKNTHFVNPHGYHDENHYSSAYDIYLMAKAAMEHKIFRTIVATTKYIIPATNLSGQRTLRTTNSLIDNWRVAGYTYSKAIGIKTGSTSAAGQCLAAAAVDEEGRTFYCIILGAENVLNSDGSTTRYSFKEAARLLEWGFKNFTRITVLDETTCLREIPVTLSDTDHVLIQPTGKVTLTLPTDYDPDRAELVIDLPESVEAPISAGQKVGSVTLTYDGKTLGTLDLVAMDDVARSDTQYVVKTIREYLALWWVKALIVLAIVLLLLLSLWIGVLRPRNQRRRRYSYSGGRPRGSYSGRRKRY